MKENRLKRKKRNMTEAGLAFVPPRWGLSHVLFHCSRGCAPSGRLTPGYSLPPFQGWDARDLNTLPPSLCASASAEASTSAEATVDKTADKTADKPAVREGLEDVAYMDRLQKELKRVGEQGKRFPEYEKLLEDREGIVKRSDQAEVDAWRLNTGRAIDRLTRE